MDGMNNGFQQDYQNFEPQVPVARSSKGKQITGLVLGIASLVDGVTAFFTNIIILSAVGVVSAAAKQLQREGGYYLNTTGTNLDQLVSSSSTGLVIAIVAVVLAIVVFVLYGKVSANGDVTKLIKVGRGLAIAGCIVGGIALIFGIIATANASSAVSVLKQLSFNPSVAYSF